MARIKIEQGGVAIVGGVTHQKFYNDAGLEVTHRIKTNQTHVFDDVMEAIAFAKQKHTYYYTIWAEAKLEGKLIGYGVPIR